MAKQKSFLFIIAFAIALSACQKPAHETAGDAPGAIEDDLESLTNEPWSKPLACKKANSTQLGSLNAGAKKLDRFLSACYAANANSAWCDQLIRPNPSSKSTFNCTYGDTQPHLMIHPDEMTWKHAFKAVTLVGELETMGIRVCQIYNWWRPEPYNANVGGAAGRHPYGTSVDVRFCSMGDMERAFTQLCKWRKAGRLRAVGYYGSTGLHFGIGDHTANTWGKACN